MSNNSFYTPNHLTKSGILDLDESSEPQMFSNNSFGIQNLTEFNEGISKIDNDQFTPQNENELDQIDKGDDFEIYFNVEKNRTTAPSSKKNLEEGKNIKNQKLMGRKKKSPIGIPQENNLKSHDRNAEDNQIRKIKTNIMENEIFNKLNKSLKDKTHVFYRLHCDISENLKKDFNEDLMKTTIRDLFYNVNISEKYKTEIDPLSNRYLIDKIESENKEIETLKILNMTYYEVIKKVREEQLELFLANIKNKEIKMNDEKNIDDYMNSLRELLKTYKEWFAKKKSRNREKKKKSKKKSFYIDEAGKIVA